MASNPASIRSAVLLPLPDGRTHEHHELAVDDVEVEVEDRLLPVPVALAHIDEPHMRHVHSS